MGHCETHKITVSGPECPICSAEKQKQDDELCRQCVDRRAPANSMVCASCLLKFGRPNFRKCR